MSTKDIKRDPETIAVAGTSQPSRSDVAPPPILKPELTEHQQEPAPVQPASPGNATTLLETGRAVHAPNAAAAAVVAHVEHLAQPFGTAAWDDGLSSRVVWMAKNDVQSAEIRLNPPDLGPIEVKLTLTSDRGAQTTSAAVQFSAAHAVTRDAIESAMPRLREMLQENGIALGNTTVDAGTAGNNSGSADPGRHPSAGAHRTGHAAESLEPAQARSAPLARRGNGLVDTFA